MKYHLIIVGFDNIVSNKYIQTIKVAFAGGYINGYSIIDLLSAKDDVLKRIQSLDFQPSDLYFLSNQVSKDYWANESEFKTYIEKIKRKHGKVKIYIATELKAHDAYLEYCMRNSIPSLIEKPILAPIKDGIYYPELITSRMRMLNKLSIKDSDCHSVMTLSRYHKIYNELVMDDVRNKMIEFLAPITSIHFRTSGGVFNLLEEYFTRNDHPYKNGYGMIMHGGYHYIDLVCQFLEMNRIIFPKDNLQVELVSYVGLPHDQYFRMPGVVNQYFDQINNKKAFDHTPKEKMGETDICAVFRLVNKSLKKVITLGTISLEQTTQSFRNWKDIPEYIYNKNGRLSFVDLQIQLSTIYFIDVQCYDVPKFITNKDQSIGAKARILKRSNVNFLKNNKYVEESKVEGLFHSNSNKMLLKKWLEGNETRSLFKMHLGVMEFVRALSLSKRRPGEKFVFKIN